MTIINLFQLATHKSNQPLQIAIKSDRTNRNISLVLFIYCFQLVLTLVHCKEKIFFKSCYAIK